LGDFGLNALAAWERNAVRFEVSREPMSESCADFKDFSVDYVPFSSGGGTVSATLIQQFVGSIAAGTKPLPGALVRIEMAPASLSCDSPTGWTLVCYKSTDESGKVSATGVFTGVVRLTLVPPLECAHLS
jgi:hypothetical protein